MLFNSFIYISFLLPVDFATSKKSSSDDMQLNLPPEPEFTWIVKGGEEGTDSVACLLGAGDIRIQQLPSPDSQGESLPPDVVVPQVVLGVEGRCGQDESELKLSWQDEEGEDNELNIVIERSGRLAALTGAFLSTPTGGRGSNSTSGSDTETDTLELTATMHTREFHTIQWPHRYGLHCPREYAIALYPAQTNPRGRYNGDVPPAAFLILENLRLEVFRRETLEDQYPEELMGDFFTLKTWECEFHMVYDWAPIVVGVGLVTLVLITVGAFIIQQYRKKHKNKYENL